MTFKSVQKKIAWTAEDRARHKAIREKFQRERPTPEELLASGEYTEPVPMGVYIERKLALQALRKEREKAGLSLNDVAARSGIDKAALSRLESGNTNPTLDTIFRYLEAIGREVLWIFKERQPENKQAAPR